MDHQYQHRDELLACGDNQSFRMSRTTDPNAGRHRHQRTECGESPLRRKRLGISSQYRPVARSRSHQRIKSRYMAHRRSVDMPASVVALRLYRRSSVPQGARISNPEPSLQIRYTGPATLLDYTNCFIIEFIRLFLSSILSRTLRLGKDIFIIFRLGVFR